MAVSPSSDPNNMIPPPDFDELLEAMENVAAESKSLLEEFMRVRGVDLQADPDPLGIYPAFQALMECLAKDPTPVIEASFVAWQNYMNLWFNATQRMFGLDPEPTVDAPKSDRRFIDSEWNDNPFFDFIKQTYLITANSVQAALNGVDDLDPHTAHKVRFFTQQYVDAMSPSNFLATNPEVVRRTLDTRGKNLLAGLRNFLSDIDPVTGRLKTKMVDDSGFELGKNVAATPGKVVFETDLMQLIQYEPTTEKVLKRPLLIVPPWINKFYILDLQAKNSFIKWCVDNGHTVFVVSWVNPDEKLSEKDFEDYVLEGPLAAIEAVERATGESEINLIGYCLGGTLTGATLAYLKATDQQRVATTTFFTSLLDFSDPGDLGVFIDEDQVSSLEAQMNARGYLDGGEMATTFNMLRANDLIWSFVVNNYLLGEAPLAFDLLYWNADSTRMPAKMHSTYLRKMYIENAFRTPGGITVNGTPIDLSAIDTPAFFVSALEDHIAPWKTTYLGAQVLGGPVEFTLAKSGHIAGIINPPGKRQYGCYRGPDIKGLTPDEWFERAESSDETWWPSWQAWIEDQDDRKVAARVPGDGQLPVLEDAPGSYVKQRVA